MQVTKIVSGADLEKGTKNLNKCCDDCQRAKQTKNKFLVSDFRVSDAAFELIHCDLWAPIEMSLSCGASYFLTIVDDYSKAMWIYLLIDKKEMSRTLKMFFSMVD